MQENLQRVAASAVDESGIACSQSLWMQVAPCLSQAVMLFPATLAPAKGTVITRAKGFEPLLVNTLLHCLDELHHILTCMSMPSDCKRCSWLMLLKASGSNSSLGLSETQVKCSSCNKNRPATNRTCHPQQQYNYM